jgi:hypothetical protein
MNLYEAVFGNVVYNLVIAIVVIAVALYFRDLLKFEKHEYIMKGESESLSNLLRSKGLRVTEEAKRIFIEGPLRTIFEVQERDDKTFKIVQSFEISPWFLSITLIIMAFNAILGLALGFLGYLYYRWSSRTIASAIRSERVEILY